MMTLKKTFTLWIALLAVVAGAWAQTNTTIRANKVETNELKVKTRNIKGISTRGSISGSGSNDSLMTQNAIKAYVTSVSSSGVSDGDKGDITVSGTGSVWTIDADVIAWGKLSSATKDSIIAGKKRVSLRASKPSTTYLADIVVDTVGTDSLYVWNASGYMLLQTGSGGGGSPTGSAGGSLTGTYPNPTFAANTVGNTQVINKSLDSTDIKNRGLALLQLNQSGATNGQVPKYNSSTGNWEPGNDNNSGGGSNFIDIANYSPTANGISNDSTAFAQAIAAAVAGGYKKIFLNGKNYYARGINNPYGVEFFGGGLVRFGPDSIAYITKDKSERLFFGQEYLSAWQKKVIANANDTIRLVFSGDSTVEGGEFVAKTTQYATDLTGLVFKSFNRGYSAQTTTRWDTLYLKQDTTAIPNMDLYVIRWGINDGFFNLGLASYQTRLRSGLAKLRAWKNSTKLGIILMTPNATSYSGTKSNEAWHDQINAIIRQAARDYQCFFFDTYSLMKDANSSRGLQTWLDNVETHPNTYAQRLIAGELAKAVIPQYLVRSPSTDFRSPFQAGTLPLSRTPDLFINGVSMHLNDNTSGTWPTDGYVLTSKFSSGAIQYIYPSSLGSITQKPWVRVASGSTWGAFNQRPYTQISGSTSVKAGNALPTTYDWDLSHLRITDSLNGALLSLRQIDNMTLQFGHSYLTDDLFYRNGYSGSWLGAGFRRVLSLSRASGIAFFSGAATNPNSIQTANVGSLYFCTANGNIWTKATGTGNTGWVQRWDANDPILLPAGTATASTAPLKFTSGTNLTTAEAGAVEYDGTEFYGTTSTASRTIFARVLKGSATLDFASTAAGAVTDLTITVTGAADGDVVSLSVPNASQTTTGSFSAWVSATNTVTVRYRIAALTGSEDPASGTFKVTVTK